MLNQKSFKQWTLIFALLLAPLAAMAQQRVQADTELASVEQLKTEAVRALKDGKFDRTSELLGRAATLSNDPALVQMSQWLAQFQSQRQELAAERGKKHDKAVADLNSALAKNLDDYALEKLRDAYLLASDKEAFLKENWVAEQVAKAKTRAISYEAKEQWIKAQRVYSHLTNLEPNNITWKEKFKDVQQRIRILAMYAPDDLKKVVDLEVKEREKAEELINPPTTQPVAKAEVEDNDSFRSDWKDLLKGIQMDMLKDALEDARQNYWKDVSYKTLAEGGLKGLQALASTRGLEKTFPGLADNTKRGAFLAAINQNLELIGKASVGEELRTVKRILDSLTFVNQNTVQLPPEVLVNEFADGAFGELDPFSTMIWPGDLPEFNKSTQGEFSGVGIQIQTDEGTGELKVVSPVEDSPAYRLHIKAGDVIIRIDGKNAKGISINQAVRNIQGSEGSHVTLTIKSPEGTVTDYRIRRETIKVASVKGYQRLPGGSWNYFVDPQQKIGYLRMTNFTKDTEKELNRALGELHKAGAKAMVLDLRGNPGGLLTAATEVCDRFLSEGTIVSTRGEREFPGQPPVEARANEDDVKIPVIVLVNQMSASASEIVSGALQDQKRALVVGERTFGKGSVQMLFPLAGKLAALKLTTSHYYLPSGRCIHKEDTSTNWGVDPDVTVEMTFDQLRAQQDARQALEVLREAGQVAATTAPTTGPAKDLLAVDPQLSTAVLLLRLQLAGVTTL